MNEFTSVKVFLRPLLFFDRVRVKICPCKHFPDSSKIIKVNWTDFLKFLGCYKEENLNFNYCSLLWSKLFTLKILNSE